MAIIPIAQKFHTLSSTVDTTDRGSSEFQSQREIYTMQDIINTVSATGGSIDGSGVQYAIPVFTDTNTITNLAIGTAGQVLTSNGAGANPSFQALQAVTSGETAANPPSLFAGTLAFTTALADTTNVSLFKGNLAVGPGALQSSVWSNNVTGVGLFAFRNQNKPSSFFATDVDSVAVGSYAGFSQTTAAKNTYVGHEAGYSNTINGNNTAIGNQALYSNDGAQNTAVGSDALRDATSVSNSVAIGTAAGSLKISGGNCIIIGEGAQASTTSVSNEITLGDSNITSLRCNVTSITSLSDERDKTDIEDLNIGLDFVKSLKPRKFVWNNRPVVVKEYYKDEENNSLEREVEVTSVKKGSKDIGFIAQELKTIDNEWSQLVNSNNPEKLEASYGRLIPVLVKAIQELSAKVTILENA